MRLLSIDSNTHANTTVGITAANSAGLGWFQAPATASRLRYRPRAVVSFTAFL